MVRSIRFASGTVRLRIIISEAPRRILIRRVPDTVTVNEILHMVMGSAHRPFIDGQPGSRPRLYIAWDADEEGLGEFRQWMHRSLTLRQYGIVSDLADPLHEVHFRMG